MLRSKKAAVLVVALLGALGAYLEGAELGELLSELSGVVEMFE